MELPSSCACWVERTYLQSQCSVCPVDTSLVPTPTFLWVDSGLTNARWGARHIQTKFFVYFSFTNGDQPRRNVDETLCTCSQIQSATEVALSMWYARQRAFVRPESTQAQNRKVGVGTRLVSTRVFAPCTDSVDTCAPPMASAQAHEHADESSI